MSTTDVARSSSLIDLAAARRTTAIRSLLSDSIGHAIAAGDLLIEAKSQLKHGQWLSCFATTGITTTVR